jgi:hypothetical protein
MSKIVLFTGGACNGKSARAEQYAARRGLPALNHAELAAIGLRRNGLTDVSGNLFHSIVQHVFAPLRSSNCAHHD